MVVSDSSDVAVDKYAVSERWSNSFEFKKPFDYTVSNGQVCLVHRLDMGDLIKLGIAEELDFMSKALVSGDAKDSETAKAAVQSAVLKGENFSRMETMVNLVVQAGVIQPPLHTPPLHEKARQAGLLYVDYLPFDDRLELFSVIFETEGLSTFREKQEASVGDVEHGAGVPLPADGPVADVQPSDPEGLLL